MVNRQYTFVNSQFTIHDSQYIVFLRQVSRHNYTQVVLGDSPDAECLAISCDSKTLAIFHTHNMKELHAVVYHNLKKLSNQDN